MEKSLKEFKDKWPKEIVDGFKTLKGMSVVEDLVERAYKIGYSDAVANMTISIMDFIKSDLGSMAKDLN